MLDDYEEGTWTPTVAGCSISVSRANYTKIGNLVTASFTFTVTASDGSTSGLFTIGGKPFQGSAVDAETNGDCMFNHVTTIANTINLSTYTYSQHSTIEIYQTRSNNSAWITLKRSQVQASPATAIVGSITYHTDT